MIIKITIKKISVLYKNINYKSSNSVVVAAAIGIAKV